MLSEEEAIKMLTNYTKSACQTCRIGKYIDCLEKCKLLQAVEVGIEAIKYKQAVYNLGKAVTKK